MPTTIRLLSDRVANQIAAGEVIERPAAVVKELVENSLDAGATRIEVEFRQGGRSYLRVEDNGCGMSRDDALLSLERHATSKIVEAADLDRLRSFGFRGEALPSIASISRFELTTRAAGDEAGVEIVVNGGKLVHVREAGAPVGTRIVVSQLFNSVPARRKFLKTDATEAAHLIHCVRLYALSCPQVAFTLIEEGRPLFRSAPCDGVRSRVREIFGRGVADELLEFRGEEAGLSLLGWIARPPVARATRHEMICFVNRRPVESRTLSYALIESCQERLPKGRYPVAFLFLDLDPAAVDVNIHPAKREIRFRHEPTVRSFVIRSLLDRLRAADEERGRETGFASAALPAIRTPDLQAQAAVSTPPAAAAPSPPGALPRASFQPTVAAPFARAEGFSPPSAAAAPAAPVNAGVSAPVALRRSWRFLGLAHGSYALFETEAGVVLLDRRAALERVWFERLLRQSDQAPAPSQRLLFPAALEFDPIGAARLEESLEFLQRHGFEVALFGRNFFRLEAVPDWVPPSEAETTLRDIVGWLREGRLDERRPEFAREELARFAASRAVRLPGAVHEEEVQALVGDLFACGQPLTTPAGRPTLIELGHAELGRRFQR